MTKKTIITGASQNHFKSLCQFLKTVENFCQDWDVYVYDLGLNIESSEKIKKEFKVNYVIFDFSKYPDFFDININRGEYAWKPAIIKEVADLVGSGVLLWCDSGNMLTSHLTRVEQVILQQGIYSSETSNNVKHWTHPGMLQFFNIKEEDELLRLPNRNGAIIGFNLDNIDARSVLDNLSKLAQIKACIAPYGSSRDNHRQDQALLTILYYLFTQRKRLEESNLGILIHCDCD